MKSRVSSTRHERGTETSAQIASIEYGWHAHARAAVGAGAGKTGGAAERVSGCRQACAQGSVSHPFCRAQFITSLHIQGRLSVGSTNAYLQCRCSALEMCSVSSLPPRMHADRIFSIVSRRVHCRVGSTGSWRTRSICFALTSWRECVGVIKNLPARAFGTTQTFTSTAL
jgi:hypothetical protein